MVRRVTFMGAVALLACAASVAVGQQDQQKGQGRGGFQGRGGGAFGPGAGGRTFLLAMPEVQRELGVNDEQKGLIEDLQTEVREQMRGIFQSSQGVAEEERRKRFEQEGERISKKAEEMIGTILEPKQVARLDEISLQAEGPRALVGKEVADKLGLAAEQSEKIKKIRDDDRQAMLEAFRNIRDLSQEERETRMAEARKRQEKTTNDLLAVLTPEQKDKFEKMKGQKFDFPQPPQGRRPQSKNE